MTCRVVISRALSIADDTQPRFGFLELTDARLLGEAEGNRCPTEAGPAVARLQLPTDDGTDEFLASQEGLVTINGNTWAVRAGGASRTEVAQNGTDCADCPSPGVHTLTRLSVLMYRAASE
jgi:hypothetical protein